MVTRVFWHNNRNFSMSSPLQRAERTANRLDKGLKILEFIRAQRQAVIAAAERNEPAVSGVSALLLKTFGAAEMKQPLARQIAGLGVRSVLAEEGFEVARGGVRIKGDALFTTGAMYRRRSDTVPDALAMIDRLAKALTLDEARCALRAVLARFPELRAEAARPRKQSAKSKLEAPR
jgi:hypothetical protein